MSDVSNNETVTHGTADDSTVRLVIAYKPPMSPARRLYAAGLTYNVEQDDASWLLSNGYAHREGEPQPPSADDAKRQQKQAEIDAASTARSKALAEKRAAIKAAKQEEQDALLHAREQMAAELIRARKARHRSKPGTAKQDQHTAELVAARRERHLAEQLAVMPEVDSDG